MYGDILVYLYIKRSNVGPSVRSIVSLICSRIAGNTCDGSLERPWAGGNAASLVKVLRQGVRVGCSPSGIFSQNAHIWGSSVQTTSLIQKSGRLELDIVKCNILMWFLEKFYRFKAVPGGVKKVPKSAPFRQSRYSKISISGMRWPFLLIFTPKDSPDSLL